MMRIEKLISTHTPKTFLYILICDINMHDTMQWRIKIDDFYRIYPVSSRTEYISSYFFHFLATTRLTKKNKNLPIQRATSVQHNFCRAAIIASIASTMNVMVADTHFTFSVILRFFIIFFCCCCNAFCQFPEWPCRFLLSVRQIYYNNKERVVLSSFFLSSRNAINVSKGIMIICRYKKNTSNECDVSHYGMKFLMSTYRPGESAHRTTNDIMIIAFSTNSSM